MIKPNPSMKYLPNSTAASKNLINYFYLAHVIEKPNLRIPNPQYFLLFKWKFDDFFIHFEFDRGNKKTKCIHKSNIIKKRVVNIWDSEFVNLGFRWREQDNNLHYIWICQEKQKMNFSKIAFFKGLEKKCFWKRLVKKFIWMDPNSNSKLCEDHLEGPFITLE